MCLWKWTSGKFFFFSLFLFFFFSPSIWTDTVLKMFWKRLKMFHRKTTDCCTHHGLLPSPVVFFLPPSFLPHPAYNPLIYWWGTEVLGEHGKKSNLIFWLYKNFVILRDALQKRKKKAKEKLFFNIYCDFIRMSCELQTEE